ncbi:hypothetical protein PGT21_017125 [Puccinia graminis f. sp. tritici]|uniref:C2H2-type domain-containing protein n=1 Tax=Puccinia graminis f. sp. tritici TaxID=56615 RepID=A0A5B0ML02_PUCGR|nr:hypothetical protein PGT21_017125 [Puccinia graminis f. sp. tritici]
MNLHGPTDYPGFESRLYPDGTYKYRCVICKSKWALEHNIRRHLTCRTHVTNVATLNSFQQHVAQSSQQAHNQQGSLPHDWNDDPMEGQMELEVDYQRHQIHQALAEEQNTNRIVNVDSNDPEGFGFGHEATNFSEADLEHLGRWISDAFAAGMHDEHFLTDPDYESDGDSEAGLPESLWFPFPHKEYYVAELILGHLHHMLSRVVYDNIRVGLSILHLILPHWDSMRRTRLKIRKLLDIHIIEHETVFNNTCFSLSLKDIVAHELANPYVQLITTTQDQANRAKPQLNLISTYAQISMWLANKGNWGI